MSARGPLTPELTVRRAVESDATALTDLALRSKAHWGYDRKFLDACRSDLAITADTFRRAEIYLMERSGRPLAFYSLTPRPDCLELAHFFVDPSRIGLGLGRRLWEHAVVRARITGASELRIESDPNAELFYIRLGAVRVGEVSSPALPGRMLPLLRYSLRDSAVAAAER